MPISCVPPVALKDAWKITEPMIEKALEKYGFGRYRPEDILADIAIGKSTLWVYFEEPSHITSCAVVKIIQYPRLKSLLIEVVAGSGLDGFEADMASVFERYAYSTGCSLIEAQGRIGWAKSYGKYGWDFNGGLFVKKL